MTTRSPGGRQGEREALFTPRIGLDESGKGDYFGPLVAAAVAVLNGAVERQLARMGVRDSKRVSDGSCLRLAAELAGMVPHEVVVIGPARYNELYARIRNVNRLLAWAHARALENLLARAPVGLVIADQFASDPRRLAGALMRRGTAVELRQAPRAEADLAVAAASILARARFLEELERLSQQVGVKLPKGATHVEPVARELVERGGVELLGSVAKLHFATTGRVAGDAGAPIHHTEEGAG
ncbi:MAG: ribonuclease HIII [Limnochordaceae bacterium]|nr:ribonuclease HIII [Limnochordaceae bacterium]